MLLSSSAAVVAGILTADLTAMEHGTEHDEVRWTDVAVHACQIMNAQRKVVFVTASEHVAWRDAIDHAVSEGCQVITIPDNIRRCLSGLGDVTGKPIRDLAILQQEWAHGFEFSFIDSQDLTDSERKVFERWPAVAELGGGLTTNVQEVRISETMRPDAINGDRTVGLWDPESGRIIVKRSQLSKLANFAGTLLHEMTHARSGCSDVSRDFEEALTDLLGVLAVAYVQSVPTS
jgi:hypothetical protein